MAALNNYQIQLNVLTESPLDFRTCAITFSTPKSDSNDTNSEDECLRSYVEIIESSHFTLKVHREQLPNGKVTIQLRTVISGCDATTRFRDISLVTVLPTIYHNSDHECIYRVSNVNYKRSMMKLLVDGFPPEADKVCHAIVEISNGDKLVDNVHDDAQHRLQAKFDSFESIEPFASGIMVSAKFAFIKVVNCYENSQPVEIVIDTVRSKPVATAVTGEHNSA